MSKRKFSIGLSLFLFFVAFLPVYAKVQQADLAGKFKGAPYRIRVPANWNGTLLVYAHGYRDRADHPGEVDNRTAEIAPSAALEPVLLAQGFALSGSAFKNNGWAVEEGIEDSKNVVAIFRRFVGTPQRTILWGFSMGSVIGFKSMEQSDGFYDGALCGCAVGAGATHAWDDSGDLTLAYDTVFGMPASWGTPADVRDTLDFETEVAPKLAAEINSPTNFAKFEFIRLVVGTPGRGIMPPPPPNFFPNWVLTDMFFATEARAELERRAGGPIVRNLTRTYSLTDSERAYLVSIGLSEVAIDFLLDSMNGRRNFYAPDSSRSYVERNADYTGYIKNPVLTMHTLYDPLVPVSHENKYFQIVQSAGQTDNLFQVYTNGNGHCAFTGDQLVTAVNAINNWVISRKRPKQSSFPPELGFLQNFSPPPLNQP